jgi:hypothetical protein
MPGAVWSHPPGWPQPDDEVTTMAILPPGEHAAALISHYLRHLTERSGLRWTDANDRDMETLASLLDVAAPQDDASDTIPPYRPAAPPQLDTRVTQQLKWEEKQLRDFEIWRQAKAEDERVDQARRMMRR